MNKNIVKCILLILTLFVLASCQLGTEATSSDKEIVKKLGQDFVNDLSNDIVPLRKDSQKLAELGLVVSDPQSTTGAIVLYDFYQLYKDGKDATVTIAFPKSDTFVVTRVIFVDGMGYYIRYEYKPNDTEDFEITTKPIDSLELIVKPKLNKVDLHLIKSGKDIAMFQFKSLVEGESSSSAG